MLQLPQKWVAGKSNFARHKTVIFDGTRAHNTYTLNQVPGMDNIWKGYAAKDLIKILFGLYYKY